MNQPDNSAGHTIESLQRARLVTETAKIRWQELEIHFARGTVVYVSADLDLVDVVWAVSNDDTVKVSEWIDAGKILRRFDELAAAWAGEDAIVWCVVVKPWVLVQPVMEPRMVN